MEVSNQKLTIRALSLMLAIVLCFVSVPVRALADPEDSSSAMIAATTAPTDPAEQPAETLSADDPGVDPTRIVALPKQDTTAEEVESTVLEAADGLDALPQTEIVSNPENAEPESLVVVESDEAVTEDLMAQMRDSGLYETVDYDVEIEPTYTSNPNDLLFRENLNGGFWGLYGFPGANFSAVWPLLGGVVGNANTAPIAVIDTAFDTSAEDAGSNIVAGYDFGSGRSVVTPDPGDGDSELFHGTSTAGLIGAATNNGKGIAGAAWDRRIVFYKAADRYDALYLSAVTNCINDVVAKKNAKIISMSLGGPSFPSYFQQAIDAAVAADILVVASSGNSAQEGNPVMYPAAYSKVLSVAAIGPDGTATDFSTYNSGVDIAAPGENIMVMGLHTQGYFIAAGTSYSCPYVSAAAALLWSANPGLSSAQVRAILLETARPIGARGNVHTGWGALDAYAAFEVASGLPFEPVITAVRPGKGTVTISWSSSGYDTTPIPSYVVQLRNANSNSWASYTVNASSMSTNAVASTSTGSFTFSGLAENTTYYVRIAGHNSHGTGPNCAPYAVKPFNLSVKTSSSSVTVKHGKSVKIRVAPYYGSAKKVTVKWSSSKKSVASVSTTGKSAQKKGKGSFNKFTFSPGRNVNAGKVITIKGLKKGTAYITFSTGYASHRVKVSVK